MLNSFKKLAEDWGGKTALFFVYMHFSQDVCTQLLVPLLPLIREDFGLSYVQAGLLLSALNLAAGLSQFLGGRLGDIVKLEVIIAVGLGGVGLATLAVGSSTTFISMLILLLIMGIVSGGYHPSASTLVSTYFDAKKRGRVVGVHMMGGNLALVAAPIIGGLIADKLNWHFAFYILGLPGIIATPLVFMILKKPRQKQVNDASQVSKAPSTSDGTQKTEKLSFRKVWQPVAAVVLLTLLGQWVIQPALAFIPLYFVDKYKIAAITAAMFIGILRAGGIPGGLIGGWVTDRWKGKNSVVITLAAVGPCLYLLSLMPNNPLLIVALILLGIALIARQTAVQTFLMDNTPPQIRSTVFGLYFGLSQEGSSLAQPVVGYFMDIFGIGAAFNFVALLAVAVSLSALFLLRKTKPTSHRLTQE